MKLRETNYSDLLIAKHKILSATDQWEIPCSCPLASLYGLFTLEIRAKFMCSPFSVALLSRKWQGMSRSLIQLAHTFRSELMQRRKLLLVWANSNFFFLLLDSRSSSFACPWGNKVAYPGSFQHNITNLLKCITSPAQKCFLRHLNTPHQSSKIIKAVLKANWTVNFFSQCVSLAEIPTEGQILFFLMKHL